MISRLIVAAIAALFITVVHPPAGTHAAEPAPGAAVAPTAAPPITLQRAIEFALDHHPRLEAARQRTLIKQANAAEVGTEYYPRVDVWLQAVRGTMNGNLAVFHSVPGLPRVGGSRPEDVGGGDSFNNYLAAATVHQLLYDFGRTGGAVEAERAFVKAAKLNEELIEQNLAFDVTSAFYAVLEKAESLAVAADGLQLTQRVLEYAKAGQNAGLRPPSESARAEADVAMAELTRIRAGADLDVARARFTNALGTPEAFFEPVGNLPIAPPPAPEAEALQMALRLRPELRTFDLQQLAFAERIRSAKAGHYPRIEALAGAGSRGQFLRGNDLEDFRAHNWNVGVVLHLPVFQGFRIAEQVKALEAETQALRSSQELVRQAIMLEVKQALAQVRAADEAVRASQKGVAAAKINFETIKGRYNTGLSNIIEITDARTAYISALSAAVRTTFGARFARAALALALGTASAERTSQ